MLGCASSAGAPASPPSGTMKLSALWVPPGAHDLGPVVVTHEDGLEAAAEEFRKQVLARGGDFGKIDETTYVLELAGRSMDMRCDYNGCFSGAVFGEVPRARLIGRAFRLSGPGSATGAQP